MGRGSAFTIRKRKQAQDPPYLELAIGRLERLLKLEALKGSTQGEANTNTIYSEIVQRIARARGTTGKGTSRKSTQSLREALLEIESRSKSYSTYALISPLQVEPLIKTLDSTSGATQRIIADVLTPYVDGLQAKLSALKNVKELTELFVSSINSFFRNKTISFDASKGIQLTSVNGERLKPQMLSSGERQILLLFCNTITARNRASIFLIDEPELSLNIKWQRKLLDALLRCTKGNPVQFVISTHSVELLTRHKAHVLSLLTKSGE